MNSLSFLFPLAWLAAAGLAAPIWLHLRRRQETNLVRFSALQFLEEQPIARQRPLWPRDWWLLALRLLALLLLVAAFAWPYSTTSDERPAIRESRVVILDNTLSHQAGDAFLSARNSLAGQVSEGPPDLQLAVIELTATPRVVVRFGDGPVQAAESVRKLEPSHQRGSYLAAFRAADALLEQSLVSQRRIVLLGDSQANQWQEGLNSPPFLENVEVELPRVEQKSQANLSVSEPTVRRVVAGNMALAEFAVRVTHRGDPPPVDLVIRENEREVWRRAIDLQGQPESNTVLVHWPTDPRLWLRGEVRLEGTTAASDGLGADNRAYFSLPPLREGSVVVLARSPYLRTALSPAVMSGRWRASFLSPAELDAALKQPPGDVLCLESGFLESNAARQLTNRYLSRGRGVLLILDRLTSVVAGFLHEQGIEADTNQAPTSPTGFRYTFQEHPVFQPFRSPDFGDLLNVRVERYRRIGGSQGVPLVYADSGDVLLLESTKQKGKLYVLAFSLDRSETNWPVDPTFIPFLDLCLKEAKAEPQVLTRFEPGEMCVWTVEDQDVKEVVLRSGEQEVTRAAVENGQARFQTPDTPGHYALSYDRGGLRSGERDGRGDPGEPITLLDVNPAPAESELKYSAEESMIASWTRDTPVDATASPAGLERLALTRPEILRQTIWWWLVLAGLAALAVETWWASRPKTEGVIA
jgi:hypothetical protein